ncbi:MAG: 3-phosphoshikimate 1-carboxyvinyltransferase [Aigarchaeota archaeon]|nr:3-phosphoshikimate 1-carboxyvinyltransferase [Aigarchaeota archaeon]MDW8092261.1 3-phosphoshikimate 1-carboxyvinyltransferase [Nitrososphaerota archaeon]
MSVRESVHIESKGPVSGTVKAPPSKSYSHRAVMVGMLADGESRIINASFSRDVLATMNAAIKFGAGLKVHESELSVVGVARPSIPDDVIDAMNSGTTIRVMTAIAGLVENGYTILTGDESLRRRPMGPLLDAMNELGVMALSSRGNGCPPVIVKGGDMGGECRIRGDVSSQFISGLLIAGPRSRRGLAVNVLGDLVSRPYIDATLYVQSAFGYRSIENRGYAQFRVWPGGYSATEFEVPGDYGLASFLMIAPLFAGGRVEVLNLSEGPPQADYRIVEILRKMGANVEVMRDRVVVEESELRGIEVNLQDAPDLLPVISVTACRARGTTVIRGVRHARYKETDRLSIISSELGKVGAKVTELEDGLIIEPPVRVKTGALDPRGDHRLFMAFAILALACEGGMTVLDPSSASVSYPSFISDLTMIGAGVSYT